MDFLKSLRFLVLLFVLPCSGCYYLKSAYNQMGLLSSRVPMAKALEDPSLSNEEKGKMRLAEEAILFAEQDLGLRANGNYSSFVKLKGPYVTYVVSASPKWELKHHLWTFPFVGSVPYKGYFDEKDAQSEEQSLERENMDTYLRGVSAFSTLGWFRDPLLSSMLKYKDIDLVNTLIHETVHATLYIKSNADFNERLAVYLGNWGAELFYLKKEGADSKTLAQMKIESQDEKKFSVFISTEIQNLEAWYKTNPEKNEQLRKTRIKEIQKHFSEQLKPELKTDLYDHFADLELNNARLLVYKTYLQDLSDFEKLADRTHRDFRTFLSQVMTLEKNPDPVRGLTDLAK